MNWLDNVTIRRKLVTGFVTINTIMVAIGVIGYFSVKEVNDNSKQISDVSFVELQALTGISYSMTENKANVYRMIEKDNRSDLEEIMESVTLMGSITSDSLKQYKELDLSDERRKEFEEFESLVKTYQKEREKVTIAVEAGDYEEAQKIVNTSYNDTKDAVGSTLNSMIDDSIALTQKLKTENENVYSGAKTLILLLTIASGILATIITTVLSRNIRVRLDKMLKFSEKLGQGDLTERVPFESKDEIGKIAVSLNESVENMQNLVSEIISGSQEMSATTEELSATMEEISVSMENVTETTHETTRGIEELSASTEEISASSEEIEHSSNDLSTKANEGGKKSEEIKVRADTVKSQAVASATSAINLYEEKQSKIYQAIEQAKVVSQIGLLADTIGEIANQTNLLSLNASIEAARAGESGRGFAVVANEVRNLAEQSNASASNIRQVISEVQRAFDEMTTISMEVMEFINSQVKPDYELLVEVGDKYQKDAEFVMDMSNEIAVASKAISDSISEVSASLLNVSATTEQTSSGSESVLSSMTVASDSVKEVAFAVQSQAELAEKLSSMAQKFKV
jgi:methyl-accepting chemotaxis protein